MTQYIPRTQTSPYIPRLAIGATRVDRVLVDHVLSERRRLCMDEGFRVEQHKGTR